MLEVSGIIRPPPYLGELLLRHRLDQLVVELENSLEVVENILTGNCTKTQSHVTHLK